MKSLFIYLLITQKVICVCIYIYIYVIEVFIKNKMEKNGLDLNEKSIM
jgi:hypothetical protein